MKRHESLQPLSRHHHLGLLFGWKIRQGLKKGIDLQRIHAYINYFWQEQLKPHFLSEENVLFKKCATELCDRALREHREIELLIKDIMDTPADTALLLDLADKTDQHIRFEERELFPALEKEFTAAQLIEIGRVLEKEAAGQETDNYQDTFWS